MGFGGTAKKIQKLADLAEKMYKRINQMVEQLHDLKGTVEETGNRVEELEQELDQQRMLLEAIADEHDIDVDSVVTSVVIEDAEGKELSDDAEAGGTDGSESADQPTGSDGADEDENTGGSVAGDDAGSAAGN